MGVCLEKLLAEEVEYDTVSEKTIETVPSLSSREESRFERRRSFENLHRTGSGGVKGRVYRRWYDYCLAGLLETGLKITSQHRRGIANALSLVIRHVPL